MWLEVLQMSKHLCHLVNAASAKVQAPLHKWRKRLCNCPRTFAQVVKPLAQKSKQLHHRGNAAPANAQHHHLSGEGARPNVQASSYKCKRHSGKRPGRFAQVTKPPGHLPPQFNTSDIVTKAKVQAAPPQCKSRSRKSGSDFTQL